MNENEMNNNQTPQEPVVQENPVQAAPADGYTYQDNQAGQVDQAYQADSQQQYTYTAPDGPAPAHGKAVASLVLGIVGICCCGICGIIGLILSISAKNEGNNEGIRTAGFVLGIISIVAWVIGIGVSAHNGTLVNLDF